MKTLHEGLPVIGWKACNFTCFKSAVFVTDSKAEDLVTLPGLCYKHTHRHVSSTETFIFHRNFSLSTWNRNEFSLRKYWQQKLLSQGRRVACPQAVSSQVHRDTQAGPPCLLSCLPRFLAFKANPSAPLSPPREGERSAGSGQLTRRQSSQGILREPSHVFVNRINLHDTSDCYHPCFSTWKKKSKAN